MGVVAPKRSACMKMNRAMIFRRLDPTTTKRVYAGSPSNILM
jgi:hypothetical protein